MGMDLEQDLRYTSDEMLRMLERLRALEMRKRKMTPGTDEFKKLAEEVERLANSVFDHSRDQDRIAADAVELRRHNVIESPPIDEIPPVRELHLILAEWRDAERRAAEAVPGSAQASDAEGDVQRLRLEYRRAAQTAWDEEQRQ